MPSSARDVFRNDSLDRDDNDDNLEWSAGLVRQVAVFHRQFTVDPHYIDLVID